MRYADGREAQRASSPHEDGLMSRAGFAQLPIQAAAALLSFGSCSCGGAIDAGASALDAAVGDSGQALRKGAAAAVPRAYVAALAYGPGCPSDPIVLIGGGGQTPGQPVATAAPSPQTPITCSVTPNGAGYAISLSATQAHGLTIRFGGNVDSSGQAPPSLQVTIGQSGSTPSEWNGCAIFDGFGVSVGSPPPPPSVAPGRIFGSLLCTQTSGAAGCSLQVGFVFENCQP
jgi:hypothetical protein